MEDGESHTLQKARPGVQSPNPSDRLWIPRDSFIGTSSQDFGEKHAKYDSDDQSSMMSEPGSPQPLSQVSEEDVSMLSDDEAASLPTRSHQSSESGQKAWQSQLQRSSTPIESPRLGHKALPNHMRSRHPQENVSSERPEVPSPIDEDEVPTPPSAAEAAGSQLELLSVSDVEMQSVEDLPRIALHSDRNLQLDGGTDDRASIPRLDTSDSNVIRKTRARSGALSASGSPMRESPTPGMEAAFGTKKGFSMGRRSDCEKCRLKLPGHMNHFYLPYD